MDSMRTRLHRLPLVVTVTLLLLSPLPAQESDSNPAPPPDTAENAAASTPAQTESTGDSARSDPPTIEELYLAGQASYAALSSMLAVGDPDTKLTAVRMLQIYADDGRLNPNDDQFVAVALGALQEGVTTIAHNGTVLPDAYQPIVRVEAARALGLSGTDAAREGLIEALRNDPEPSVRAAAMLSLGRLGEDPEGQVTFYIARALTQETMTSMDEGMVFAGLVALEALVERNGADDLDETVRDSVVTVATAGFNRRIREQAVRVLVMM